MWCVSADTGLGDHKIACSCRRRSETSIYVLSRFFFVCDSTVTVYHIVCTAFRHQTAAPQPTTRCHVRAQPGASSLKPIDPPGVVKRERSSSSFRVLLLFASSFPNATIPVTSLYSITILSILYRIIYSQWYVNSILQRLISPNIYPSCLWCNVLSLLLSERLT